MLGIAYAGIERLPKDAQPPMELAFQWASEAETVRGHNRMVNAEASRLTQFFAAAGRKTAVLKGPANAMLYPDPLSRQCGDIDLWVEGGRKNVLKLLKEKNLIAGEHSLMMLYAAPHHVDLAPGPDGIHVEIHFEPSSGNKDPFANRRMMRYLAGEIAKAGMAPGGFCVPSIRFALVMPVAYPEAFYFYGDWPAPDSGLLCAVAEFDGSGPCRGFRAPARLRADSHGGRLDVGAGRDAWPRAEPHAVQAGRFPRALVALQGFCGRELRPLRCRRTRACAPLDSAPLEVAAVPAVCPGGGVLDGYRLRGDAGTVHPGAYQAA